MYTIMFWAKRIDVVGIKLDYCSGLANPIHCSFMARMSLATSATSSSFDSEYK